MRRGFAFVVSWLLACGHPAALRVPVDGPRAWALLTQTLPGKWTVVGKLDASGQPFVVSYRLVSNESALVEVWGDGSGHDTETVFHPDHADVLLTHYCAQGNQPRLRVSEVTGDTVVFSFVDVTNRGPNQDMLVARMLRVTPGAVFDTEVYRAPDGREEKTVVQLVRVRVDSR